MPYFSEHSSLSRVFGFTSYSPAVCVEKNVEVISAAAVRLMNGCSGTFKIETNRADKQFPLTSLQINILIGRQLEEQKKLIYVRSNPQHTLKIEINQEGACLFTETFPCGGGLPVGVEGKVLLLVEDEASVLAGILMMKRGCAIVPVSLNKEVDVSLLQKYSPFPLMLKKVRSEEEMEELAKQEKALALITGDSFDSFQKRNFSLPLFKPLMGYSEEEIKEKLMEY